MFESREAAILETLMGLPGDFVLIGGYAVNAYVPPRFSIDCDLFVFGGVADITKVLLEKGFGQAERGEVHHGEYIRFVRESDKVSFDLLENAVVDRETGIAFERSLLRQYSGERFTVGRASPTRIRLRIADPELLFAMKFVSARRQDIRDIFMLSCTGLSWGRVEEIVKKKCSPELIEERSISIRKKVVGAGYRDGLHGAFGKIPDETFRRCQSNLLRFLDRLA